MLLFLFLFTNEVKFLAWDFKKSFEFYLHEFPDWSGKDGSSPKNLWKSVGIVASVNVKAKIFTKTCVKNSKEDFMQDYCNGGKKLNSAPNIAG